MISESESNERLVRVQFGRANGSGKSRISKLHGTVRTKQRCPRLQKHSKPAVNYRFTTRTATAHAQLPIRTDAATLLPPHYCRRTAAAILPPCYCRRNTDAVLLPPQYCRRNTAAAILPPQYCRRPAHSAAAALQSKFFYFTNAAVLWHCHNATATVSQTPAHGGTRPKKQRRT